MRYDQILSSFWQLEQLYLVRNNDFTKMFQKHPSDYTRVQSRIDFPRIECLKSTTRIYKEQKRVVHFCVLLSDKMRIY